MHTAPFLRSELALRFLGGLALGAGFLIPLEISAQPADPPDFEACSAPDEMFGGDFFAVTPDAITDTLSFTTTEVVGELRISLEVVGVELALFTATVGAPDGTTIVLHDGGGDGLTSVIATYTDYGRPNGAPYECSCLMQTPAGGRFGAFVDSDPSGDWTLELSSTDPILPSVLEEWCVQVFAAAPAPPVTNLACEEDLDIVHLSWENGAEYDSIAIYVDGVLTQRLDGGETGFDYYPFLYADLDLCVLGSIDSVPRSVSVCCSATTSALTCTLIPGGIDLEWIDLGAREYEVRADGALVATVPGSETSYTYSAAASSNVLLAVDAVSGGGAPLPIGSCAVGIAAILDLDYCEQPDVEISAFTVNHRELEILDTGIVGQVELALELESDLDTQSGLEVWLTSPQGTRLRLIDGSPFPAPRVSVTIADGGTSAASTPFDCACVLAPAWPARLADFRGDDPQGTWALDLDTGSILFLDFSHQLEEWCLHIDDCGDEAPRDLECADRAGGVEIDWTNSATYDSIDVFRDGGHIATLAGTATSYLDARAPGGRLEYSVEGRSAAISATCARVRAHCGIERGLAVECDAPGTVYEPGSWTSMESLEFDAEVVVDAFEFSAILSSGERARYLLELTSPAGTTVLAMDRTDDSVDVTFSLDGVPFSNSALDAGLTMQPRSEWLDAFTGEQARGEWVLGVRVINFQALPLEVTLEEWCVRVFGSCALEAPENLLCTAVDDAVELTWANPESYSRIEVLDGVDVVASVDGDFTSTTLFGVVPGRKIYRLRGVKSTTGCSALSRRCEVDLERQEACSERTVALVPGSTALASIEIDATFTVVEAAVHVAFDIDGVESINDWSVRLISSAGTEVELLGAPSAPVGLLDVEFATEAPFMPSLDSSEHRLWPECGCRLQPYRGDLSLFRGENASGTWTLALEPPLGSDGAELEFWCLSLHGECTLAPPSGPNAETLGGDVVLSWRNEADYDSLVVERDRAAVAVLDGIGASYVDVAVPPGHHDYRIVAADPTGTCEVPSATIAVSAGAMLLCSTDPVLGEEQIVVDTLEVPEEITVGSVEVSLTIGAGLTLRGIFLESPAGTAVALLTASTGPTSGGELSFATRGRPYARDLFLEGHSVHPLPVAILEAFEGEILRPGDVWRLRFSHLVAPAPPLGPTPLEAWCLRIYPRLPEPPLTPAEFLRGDVDGDGFVNSLLDAIALLNWSFLGGPEPACLDAADADDSGGVLALLDALRLLLWGFQDGLAPPAPGPDRCGPDPSDDAVDCTLPPPRCK